MSDAASTPKPHILLVEDDESLRRSLTRVLKRAGYEVSACDDGLSAYQLLREQPFDLILTDIVMPEMDGIELARRAQALNPNQKIIFITGFAAVALNNTEKDKLRGIPVLSKPFHLNELEKVLAETLVRA